MYAHEPVIGIQMKPTESSMPQVGELEDAVPRMKVLLAQSRDYICRDYLGRRRQRLDEESDDSISLTDSDDYIDTLCREKMCEWSYRVCEHFHTNREIVAISYSFLDRFVDRCSCDRTAFKLAAMTTLYMATKIYNSKQISIASLADLSRGEFEMAHISEMERIILETLEWRLSPPTAHAILLELQHVFPMEDIENSDRVYARAAFFVELSVYDYTFATEDCSLIAAAALLNAVEAADDTAVSELFRHQLLRFLKDTLHVSFEVDTLENAQGRLWYLYSCSAQEDAQDFAPLHVSKSQLVKISDRDAGTGSPVSVSIKGKY